MTHRYISLLLFAGLSLSAMASRAEPPAPAAESADALLARVDKQGNSFNDAFFHYKLRILEASAVRELELEIRQKGTQKRLVRFLAPADIKGMAFLFLSADTTYVLLPAFGNRVRRLGNKQLNASLLGSDMNFSDLSAVDLGRSYAPKSAGSEGGLEILELSLRPGKQSEFPRLKLWLDPKNATISKLESMDASGKKLRTAELLELKQDGPSHWSPGKIVYTDHGRGNHQTELILLESKLDNGFSDDEFTVRALQRP
jgi:hypothetical protein